MRADSPLFAFRNESDAKEPLYVIEIEFEVESIYLTSHAGIDGIPGILIENVLQDPSAISQRIVPDEGRSEIGAMSFKLVDVGSAFTETLREHLANGYGLRGRTVRLYIGYLNGFVQVLDGFGRGSFSSGGFGTTTTSAVPSASFSDFQLFQTQIIVDGAYNEGTYEVKCSDITREQRADIFDPKLTTLRDSISATDTTIPVYTTAAFDPVFHGPSYSDAPSSTVGYIKLGDEFIRWTGKTADTFTGCTRAVLNTKAAAQNVDPATDATRRPKITECIYLEIPAVKLAYAINTGILYGDSATLPEHWHLGIDDDFIRLSDFTGIGQDLWNTALDTDGFVVRFLNPGKTDGKKFLEQELYMLLGCYSPIYSDGTLGLKRMNQVLADAAYVKKIDESNIVDHGTLQHAYSSMHNRLQIDWNWNGDEFTRTTLFLDSTSRQVYGDSPLKKLQFKGLHGSRHTEAIIRKRLDAFRDRYTSPPELTSVTLLPSLNALEVGDIVRDQMINVRDYAGSSANIDRSFEIQYRSWDFGAGAPRYDLFGSTAPASVNPPNDTGAGFALPDAFYTAAGTNLTSVVTITVIGGVGVVTAGSYTINGNDDANASGAIYYYNGDLDIPDGVTIHITKNVQLRIKGFLTINGDITGAGAGHAGASGSSTVGGSNPGISGFVGNSRGADGIFEARRGVLQLPYYYFTTTAAVTQGRYGTFPVIDLSVAGSVLAGIPSDLQGTSGGSGGQALSRAFETSATHVSDPGGAGAIAGAGLVTITRGLDMGASGSVILSGADSVAPATVQGSGAISVPGPTLQPGAGGSGGPGSWLLLLDGSSQNIPDLGGKFFALTGTVPEPGFHMLKSPARALPENFENGGELPHAGLAGQSISNVDLSNVCFRIQYIPGEETPQEDQNVPTPADADVDASFLGNTISWAALPDAKYSVVEVYAATSNDRTGAILVGEVRGTVFNHALPSGGTRFYWVRARNTIGERSGFNPSSSTGGLSASTSGGGVISDIQQTFVDGPIVTSNEV